jgi:hypothetical protein
MLKADQERREIVESWFKDHKVDQYGPRTLVFKRPGTSNYAIRYDLIGTATLVVSGDLGAAVYQWHGNPVLSWKWLGGLNLDYFVGKCVASETGIGAEEWDPRVAREVFHWRLTQDLEVEEMKRASKIIADTHEFDPSSSPFNDRAAWNRFADEELREVWEDLEGILDIGLTTTLRAIAHWRGIVLALADWDSRGSTTGASRRCVTQDLVGGLRLRNSDLDQTIRKDGVLLTACEARTLFVEYLRKGYDVLPVCDHHDEAGHCLGHPVPQEGQA